MTTQRRPPPMGWNSWNSGIELTERTICEVVDAMVSSGMRAAGYRYVNLDAGWAAPERDADGALTADPVRFPRGMSWLAGYAHDRGLLLGLYSSPYNEICGQDPRTASAGSERADARQFAEWGIDFLKYDWCRVDAERDEQVRVFTAMREALQESGRPILYSINPNSSRLTTAGIDHSWSGVADMCRNGVDLIPLWRNPQLPKPPGIDSPMFTGVIEQFDLAADTAQRGPVDVWSDADMLVVGTSWSDFTTALLRNVEPHPPQPAPGPFGTSAVQPPDLTVTEQRTHFSLWAMLPAPLIVGADVRTMSDETRSILLNDRVIAVNQDPRAQPARRSTSDSRVLTRGLADGSVAVAVYNPDTQPALIGASLPDTVLAPGARYAAQDLWTGVAVAFDGDLKADVIEPHGCRIVKIFAH